MATSAAKEMRYSYGTVSGNLAHSLDREVLEHDLRHAGELTRPREEVREQPRVRSLEKVQVRERQHVSPVTVAGFVTVIALAVMVLMNYIQLTAISSDVVAITLPSTSTTHSSTWAILRRPSIVLCNI